MTTTTISGIHLGPGLQWSTTAPGDYFIVASGAIVASYTLVPFILAHDGTRIDIYGEVRSIHDGVLVEGGNAIAWVGHAGQVTTTSAVATDAALALVDTTGAAGSSALNYGTVTAIQATGMSTAQMGSRLQQEGFVLAQTGLRVADGAHGSVVYNTGYIGAPGYFAPAGPDDGHGISVSAAQARIVNAAEGVIEVAGSDGDGIHLGTGALANDVTNRGVIVAEGGWGVDAELLDQAGGLLLWNTITGSITGGAGAVRGGAGDDAVENDGLMTGGIELGAGDDVLDGGSGTILGEVFGNTGDDQIASGKGNDTVWGNRGVDRIEGGLGDDVLHGNREDDTLDGGQGDDVLFGGNQNDLLIGWTGADTLYGGNAEDILQGGIGSDTLFGDDGDDVLEGGNDNDTLDGGAGADILTGGNEDDVLTGGADADIFVFDRLDETDLITDFSDGLDRIDVTALGIGFADVMSVASVSGGGVQLDLGALSGGNTLVQLDGVALADLDASDFLF